ncbi:hypothetical protein Bca52824_055189 [Brassica carinata]|uniref:DUF7870 domain-containing protein n=1 Tax=Brassica carinata TaxID=52824 RepID=A0A8X7R7K5_BRACI|nr:hypothetical protein Bca52824_055189 [Brassica carinata]
MYKTETVNGEMSFEPENMGMMKEWLKENVKEEKYVVMKAEVEFEMYKTETVNGEMSFEPENMGMMKEWLKENVKEEKYVVMKAEVEVKMWMVMSRTSYLYHRALDYIAITFPLDPIVIAATERISSVHRSKKNVGVNAHGKGGKHCRSGGYGGGGSGDMVVIV